MRDVVGARGPAAGVEAGGWPRSTTRRRRSGRAARSKPGISSRPGRGLGHRALLLTSRMRRSAGGEACRRRGRRRAWRRRRGWRRGRCWVVAIARPPFRSALRRGGRRRLAPEPPAQPAHLAALEVHASRARRPARPAACAAARRRSSSSAAGPSPGSNRSIWSQVVGDDRAVGADGLRQQRSPSGSVAVSSKTWSKARMKSSCRVVADLGERGRRRRAGSRRRAGRPRRRTPPPGAAARSTAGPRRCAARRGSAAGPRSTSRRW